MSIFSAPQRNAENRCVRPFEIFTIDVGMRDKICSRGKVSVLVAIVSRTISQIIQ